MRWLLNGGTFVRRGARIVSRDRSQFTLSDGRTVGLQSLKQWAVYAGILEGLPTRQFNDAELKRLVEEAEAQDRHPPFLIVPVQVPISYEGRYPFGEPAKLPPIACIARFHSYAPARDASKDCSDLTVIWFQQDFAFPLDGSVEQAILAMNWNALARDVEY
jgi:hypothetical protein